MAGAGYWEIRKADLSVHQTFGQVVLASKCTISSSRVPRMCYTYMCVKGGLGVAVMIQPPKGHREVVKAKQICGASLLHQVSISLPVRRE